ncbi:hypothetical protein [Niabella sp.]|uniref:hypothetical protein n=1 Tax=Niabella sp. TaxID=1962976 RepID=UPI002622FE97|nr:hypothetical protein [Niabella sp.]
MTVKLLTCILVVLAGIAGFKPLHEPNRHHPGSSLAAQYPNDVGIEQDPDVLYAEKFNDGMPNILARYTDVVNSAGMSLDSVDVPAKGCVALKMTNQGGKNDGGHLFRRFDPGFDSVLYVRYYVKYPSDSKGYIHHESVWVGGYAPATRYPHPRAGTCALGDQRISIAYEPVGPRDDMDTYLYWGDMRAGARGKCYGNDMINGSPQSKKIPWDEWTCIELMIRLNHPATASNGALQVWQDGAVVGHWGPGFPNGKWQADSWMNDKTGQPFEGFRWRINENLNLNYIWIEFYDDTTPEGTSHHIKFSNLVIAKRYIGPVKP